MRLFLCAIFVICPALAQAAMPALLQQLCSRTLSSSNAAEENARVFSQKLGAALELAPEEITYRLDHDREKGNSRWILSSPVGARVDQRGVSSIEAAEPLTATDLNPHARSLGTSHALTLIYYSEFLPSQDWTLAQHMQSDLEEALKRTVVTLPERPRVWLSVAKAYLNNKTYLQTKIQIHADLENEEYMRVLMRVFVELDRRWMPYWRHRLANP